MKFKNIENEKVKLPDGRTIYLSRSVAVVGTICCILNNVPYFLISKRGEGAADYQGLYNISCGYLDNNENTSQATLREVWEECGIDLTEIKNIKVNNMNYPWDINSDITENRQNVVMHHGLIGVVNELPIPNIDNNAEQNEVEEVLWVSIYDYQNYTYAFAHKDRIAKYIEKNKYLFKFYNIKYNIVQFLMKLI